MYEMTIFHHPSCAQHSMGETHPESPARYTQTLEVIQKKFPMAKFVEPAMIAEQLLQLAHEPDYIQHIFSNATSQKHVFIDPDTSINQDTLAAAMHAAGCAIQAVDHVLSNDKTTAFCLIRPPGHHAEYNCAMGFCIFNNIALAAKYALEHHSLARVAIIDFDVHHGNGTQSIIKNDKRILFCSSYQHPFYPNRYNDSDDIYCCHAQLTADSGSEEFRRAVEPWFKRIKIFNPDLILISAGFDAHRDDPLAQLNLTESDYRWITEKIREINVPIVSMLEGGYDIDILARCVVTHLKALQDKLITPK